MSKERYSAKILEEAAAVQIKKGADYQSELSSVRQADYYPHGVDSIMDIVNAKYLRIKSVLEKMKNGGDANYESVYDSMIDSINYLSFAAAYLEGEVDGQVAGRDIFNRNILNNAPLELIPSKFKPKEVYDDEHSML